MTTLQLDLLASAILLFGLMASCEEPLIRWMARRFEGAKTRTRVVPMPRHARSIAPSRSH